MISNSLVINILLLPSLYSLHYLTQTLQFRKLITIKIFQKKIVISGNNNK